MPASVFGPAFDESFHDRYLSRSTLMQPGFDEHAIDNVLDDFESRISAPFHLGTETTPAFRAEVRFWLSIYTQYSTQQLVLFDAIHPEMVYEVLDFRPLGSSARNAIVYEILEKRRAQASLLAYQSAFRHLSRVHHPRNPTHEEQMVLNAKAFGPRQLTFAQMGHELKVQRGQRDNMVRGLLLADAFFPKMESLFLKMGLPIELTRLTLVESSFNHSAISRVGAAGIWQFMPDSGREYLLVDDRRQIDERLSPLKSTVAAGKLLRRNYHILGNWALAVTAYNHGVRNLRPSDNGFKREQLSDRRVDRMLSLGSKSRGLGWASKNYYAEFLAVLHAEAYRGLFFGQPPAPPLHSMAFTRVDREQDAVSFALSQGLSIEEFRAYNPDVRDVRSFLPKGFVVALPGSSDDLADLTDQISTRRAHPVEPPGRRRS